MTKHKTAELSGALLDAAVAKAEGDGPTLRLQWPQKPFVCRSNAYSSQWDHGGPIIDRERLHLMPVGTGLWQSWYTGRDVPRVFGATPLIAAMRAYVASKFGEDVEI